MVIQEGLTVKEKLHILADAAKYDVACTSSGSKRAGVSGRLGSAAEAGICHSFAADGRCISLLKILLSNECVFDCKYCVNRASSDVPRATFTPEEICTLTMEFYKRNYIEGLFLSSGVVKSPSHTMSLMYETLYLLRFKYQFMGYIHVKGIPGADQGVLERIGYLADRMSVNLELPTSEALKRLAPGKTRKTILEPMRLIRRGMESNPGGAAPGAYWTSRMRWGEADPLLAQKRAGFSTCIPGDGVNAGRIFADDPGIRAKTGLLQENGGYHLDTAEDPSAEILPSGSGFLSGGSFRLERSWLPDGRLSNYVPAGQSTQMIIGAAGESDYQIMAVSEALYRNYDMKRVFYSGFLKTTDDSSLPDTPGGPPLLREHRLYQADWLLRYYGFQTEELVNEKHPNFNLLLDPKCDWAIQHLEQFPVEVMRAPYEQLLRVPGIGVKSAQRIVKSRRFGRLDYDSLKRMGVVLKRAHYFITCQGKLMLPVKIEEGYITRGLMSVENQENWQISHPDQYRQLSLFADFSVR
ncbi:MAG: putative DNA modification/repair radical SAM protein [Lachnospiraceae bacterium]|nr:putative DNA modification/repair radical SAM protein [Lachnospiraceae bacterium]